VALTANIPTAASAYWNQRGALAGRREHLLALLRAVNAPGDLSPQQAAQFVAVALEFAPDVILELGRGFGNSTCAFAEATHLLAPKRCRVLSLCLSDAWTTRTVPALQSVVNDSWFEPIDARVTDILAFDFVAALRGHQRVLVFWDAHGFAVAECVLGKILPAIAGRPHLVLMHDLLDARYAPGEVHEYGEQSLWMGGNEAVKARLRLGHIESGVEQAVAAVDFTTRNRISLSSADHSLQTEIETDAEKKAELRRLLGDQLFAHPACWFYFTLNERPGPYTFPRVRQPGEGTRRLPWSRRLQTAVSILLRGHE
jgi:hypothetical protein